MKKLIIAGIALFLATATLAQPEFEDRLSIEFGYDENLFEMSDLNLFYVDSVATQTNPKILDDGISSGQSFRLSLKYRPTGLFDFGIYGIYQYGETTRSSQISATNELGMIIGDPITSKFSLRTEALSFGVTANVFVSHILGFHEKESVFISRSHVSTEFQAGMGYSRAVLDTQIPSSPNASSYEFFKSSDFQGSAGLRYAFDLTQSTVITSVGFRVGYQFFKTEILANRMGNEWIVSGTHPINLDFSGLYYGVFVAIGK